jgi:hypothetical protein
LTVKLRAFALQISSSSRSTAICVVMSTSSTMPCIGCSPATPAPIVGFWQKAAGSSPLGNLTMRSKRRGSSTTVPRGGPR